MPVTASRSRSSMRQGAQFASRAASTKWDTASARNVPEPQAGSSTRCSSGLSTSSRTIVRASQAGV